MAGVIPRYRAMAKLFLNSGVIEVGKDFDWEGPPNYNMEPLNQPAKDRCLAYYRDHPEANGGDPIAKIPLTIDPKDALVKPTPLSTPVSPAPSPPVPPAKLVDPNL